MLGIQRVNGSTKVDVSKKSEGKKEYTPVSSKDEVHPKAVDQRVVGEGSSFRISQGRTLNLGNYESARVHVSFGGTNFKTDIERDQADGVVREILAQEIAILTNQDRDRRPLGITSEFVHPEAMYVRLEYGLTLNLGNFESARVDVAVTMPVESTGNTGNVATDITDAASKAQNEAGERIQREAKAIKGLKGGSDIGPL